MLKALISAVGEDGYISLENRMACGIGALFTPVFARKKKKIRTKMTTQEFCYDWTSLFS